jgi:membrane associated rhomboid family serine protease
MTLRQEADKLLGRSADSLTKLIMVNVIVFVIANILNAIPGTKFIVDDYLSLPPSFSLLARYPWTLFTYMFVHVGFMHILSNMLWLYWIGIIFADFMGQTRLVYTYILGGIAGGILYIATFPLLYPRVDTSIVGNATLIGASAGVMAVIVAAAMLVPDYELMLLLFGRVKLKYLAIAAFILTSVIDFGINSGGKVSHFGGAIYGAIFLWQYRKGNDISGGFANFIKGIGDFFKGKRNKKARPMKNKFQTSNSRDRQRRIDEILDKISRSGYDSLSKEEKEFLFKSSKEN